MNYQAASRNNFLNQLMILSAGLLLVSASTAKSASIPALPEPHIIPGAHSSWIARQILHNGVPMSILQFNYPGPANEIADHYRDYLSGKPALIEFEHNKLSVIYEKNGYLTSVQVLISGRNFSEGKIITSKILNQTPSQLGTEIPLISGSTIISKTQSIDGRVNSETLMVSNYHSIEANYRYFEQELKQRGWQKNQENITLDITASQNINFSKESQKLQITLFTLQKNTNGNTGLLIHLLK